MLTRNLASQSPLPWPYCSLTTHVAGHIPALDTRSTPHGISAAAVTQGDGELVHRVPVLQRAG